MAARRVVRGAAGAAVVTALLAVGSVACGRSSDPVAVATDLDAAAVVAAGQRTTGANTAKVHMVSETSISGFPGMEGGSSGSGAGARSTPGGLSLSFTGDGAYDRAAKRSTMTIDLGPMFDRMLSAMDGPSGTGGGAPPSFEEQIVQAGTDVYLRMPMLASMGTQGGPEWIKVDATKAGAGTAASGMLGTLGGGGGTGDPSAYLEALQGVGADLTTVGHEPIGGIDTTHVRAVVSMRKALEASGIDRARMQQAMEPLTSEQRQALDDLTFPVDVYVDAQGLVRRITISSDLGETAKAMTGTSVRSGLPDDAHLKTTTTYDFSDFGAPVVIDVPPADQVMDLCAALRSLGTSPRVGAPAPSTTLPAGLC